MPLSFEGVLADRSTWRRDNCSIGRSMEGNKHLQGEDGGPLRLVGERGTGEPVVIGARTASSKDVELEDLAIVAHGDWAGPQSG